jgi:hypothetical protein
MPVPQVRTLKLNVHPLCQGVLLTILLSQILCAFENLEELFLRDELGGNTSYAYNGVNFGQMFKNSPWLRMLDISALIRLGLSGNVYDQKQIIMQKFLNSVKAARHGSLQLTCIQIDADDFKKGNWGHLKDLNDMKFVGA